MIEESTQTVSVRFYSGGTLIKTETLEIGNALGNAIPDDPVPPEGETFAGWFVGENQVTEETVVTEDMTVTARFTQNPDALDVSENELDISENEPDDSENEPNDPENEPDNSENELDVLEDKLEIQGDAPTGKTLIVDADSTEEEGSTYPTIQGALDYIKNQEDKDGWTITVHAGTYTSFHAYPEIGNLTITGQEGAVVDASSGSVYIAGDTVTLSHLTFTTTNTKWNTPIVKCYAKAGSGYKGNVYHDTPVIFESCTFQGTNAGGAIWASRYNQVISNCTFEGFGQTIEFMYEVGHEDKDVTSGTITVTGNTVKNCDFFLHYGIISGITLNVTNNTVVGSADKVCASLFGWNGENITVSGNNFQYAAFGLQDAEDVSMKQFLDKNTFDEHSYLVDDYWYGQDCAATYYAPVIAGKRPTWSVSDYAGQEWAATFQEKMAGHEHDNPLEIPLNQSQFCMGWSYHGLNLSYSPWGEVEVSGEKTWDDKDNQDGLRPKSVTIHLLANGVVKDTKTVEADKDGKWLYDFGKQPKYDDQGQEIQYTITEESVEGYTAAVDDFNVTNRHTPHFDLTVKKVWKDDGGEHPKSVTIQLLKDGKAYSDKITLSQDEDWRYTFTDLPDDGSKYTVTEENVSGYTASVSEMKDNTITITNTKNLFDLTVKKVWKDDGGKHPKNVTIQLFKDGEAYSDKIILSQDENWRYTFAGLPDDGSKYTVKEGKVSGYTASVSEMKNNTITVTNTKNRVPYTPGGGSLIQTGQLNWPIPVMVILGAGMVAGGILLLSRKKKGRYE